MNTIVEHELGPQGWAIDWFHGGVQGPDTGPRGRVAHGPGVYVLNTSLLSMFFCSSGWHII